LQDSHSYCNIARALEIAKEVEYQILGAPTSPPLYGELTPLKVNPSCQLYTHGYDNAVKDMHHKRPDYRLGAIYSLGLVANPMVVSSLFVDHTFEATEI
jgi:hypothetical protein